MNDRTQRIRSAIVSSAMMDWLRTAAGRAGSVPAAQRISFTTPGTVPANPSNANAAAACMACLRSLGFIAIAPRIANKTPANAGINAVGCSDPVSTKPAIPRTISKTPKMMVSFGNGWFLR